ncbi:peptidoglycan DD-metalloendopeptidase family protein [Aurantiacibacter sp. MUD11]|uniref:murein hydrolase activator EnvC family protein n=1 Tax=Aurantiacibacter sp. MUD11 TaxID=3003265 RepID=UPI0022AADB5E|nr:peptidoglycan DD-metalloendopeptidase family protein [Aurantiacibacter sp. MUD11]WAT17232.1 peptidoglycan DD-metalloendopeptidase family protein [Aurantiacibacter sp. MUD11]
MHRWLLLVGSLAFCAVAASGQLAPASQSPEDMRASLSEALQERAAAEARSARFEQQAQQAEDAAERAASQAAALAARIQQAEAGITAARARIAMIDREQADLREELGREQQPVVELTAALQQFSRRPMALSILRPGSVKDVVYLRALLHDRVPQVQASTQGLRNRIDRSRELRREALAAAQVLEAEETELAARREELAEIETRQRLAARAAGSSANREAERALALAEEARDLDQFLGELDRAAALRSRLAALPGPRLRPADPAASEVAAAPSPTPSQRQAGAPRPYMLPVSGRTLTGFGAPLPSGLSQGITLAPIGGAQVVAPAAGRVAFAGAYRGYGRIVIIEHPGGWTSLVTGLARSDVTVGEELVSGSPIGVAGPSDPSVTLELRREGEPVNPLLYAG